MSKIEQLKLEHTTLLAEYNSARDEINALLDSSRQVLSLTLTGISLFVGVLSFTETIAPIVFLILPFVLYGLTWVQLRYILLIRRSSTYIAQIIAPRVREILAEISPQNEISIGQVLGWGEKWQSPGQRSGGLWLLPVLGSSFGMPIFAGILSVVGFLISVSTISVVEWVLIVLNVFAIGYSLTLGFLVEFRSLGESDVRPTPAAADRAAPG